MFKRSIVKRQKIVLIITCFFTVLSSYATSLSSKYVDINTGVPGVDCKVRKLALHEKESMLFGDAYIRFLKLNGAAIKNTFWGIKYHDCDLVQVIMKNDSEEPLILKKYAYLTQYVDQVIPLEKMLQNYFFLEMQKVEYLYAGLSFFGLLQLLGLGVGIAGIKNRKLSLIGISCGSLAVLGPLIVIYSLLAKNQKFLMKKYKKLKKFNPVIKVDNRTQPIIPHNDMYVVPPHTTFIDTLIVDLSIKNNH